jgi:hypothetical protein
MILSYVRENDVLPLFGGINEFANLFYSIVKFMVHEVISIETNESRIQLLEGSYIQIILLSIDLYY